MTFYAFSSACESGLLYSFLVLGIFISFRVMKIPDLTADGSFTTGAAVSSLFTLMGKPILGILVGFLAGALAGLITAFLHNQLKMPSVLAGILTMTALYSINLRLMNQLASISFIGKKTLFTTLSSAFQFPMQTIILSFLLITCIVVGLYFFFRSPLGLAIRATGDNEAMVRSSSINTHFTKAVALALSNGLIAACGAILTQQQNYSDINMGSGIIVFGLASLILGEALLKGKKSILRNLISAVIGSVLFRLLTAFVLQVNIRPSDLKLISAVVVILIISAPKMGQAISLRMQKRGDHVHARTQESYKAVS